MCLSHTHAFSLSGRQGYQSEPLAKWVAERTGIQVCTAVWPVLPLKLLSVILHIYICFITIVGVLKRVLIVFIVADSYNASSQLHPAHDLGPGDSPRLCHWLHEERESTHTF